ncbi:MAG: hypothetical protein IIU64_00365, partial [Alistipes sp.]|nr:hypothetical protein [Alistipes sp.]
FTTLASKDDEGLYLRYCHLSEFWSSGRKYCLFTTKSFYRQSGAFTTLASKDDEGLYLRYCPLSNFGVAAENVPLSR